MVQSLYRRTWSKIATGLSLTHSLPILIDEVELCLLAHVIFLASTHTVGFKVSLASCLGLHLLRGGYRWQLSPVYFSVFAFFAMNGYSTAVRAAQIFCAVISIALCYVIPSVPLMDGRGKALGVQDLTFEGPSGKFWVKCFYPTCGTADKSQDQYFPSQSKYRALKAYLSIATIIISISTISYLEATNRLPSLLWFSVFALIHSCRLAYDAQYALPSSAYISSSEFPSVLHGVADFAKLPKLLFSHMSHMRINCTEDAPVFNENNASNGGKLKVAFVLHGLGGTRSFYSFICMRLAAEGFFVVSPEFGDGTACMSLLPDGSKRQYKPYTFLDGEIEMCEGNLKFRRDQLEHRAAEMEVIVRYFSSLSDQKLPVGKAPFSSAPVVAPYVRWNRMAGGSESFFSKSLSMDTAGSKCSSIGGKVGVQLDITNPFIVGHSFGGATAIHLQSSPDKLAAQFRSSLNSIPGVAVLDAWMWPLSSPEDLPCNAESTDAPAPILPVPIAHPVPAPYLVMHAEYFQWATNAEQERSVVRAQEHVMHVRVTDAGHNNFTDTGFLSPVITGHIFKPKKTGMQDPAVLQETINDMIATFLADCYTHTLAKASSTATVTPPSDDSEKDEKETKISLLKCLSLAQETKCFEILEARW